MMKAIITVLGNDKVGIIAKVCTFLADRDINILDISQTIIQGYFNMLMIVEMNESDERFAEIADGLENLGNEIGVIIKIQHEDIFNSMHRI
ncbi:MAG: ACT domain-containing protein [Clostridia bacterium]|nr:ACT domain-containing protein [Clostridia bacterium]